MLFFVVGSSPVLLWLIFSVCAVESRVGGVVGLPDSAVRKAARCLGLPMGTGCGWRVGWGRGGSGGRGRDFLQLQALGAAACGIYFLY